MGSDVVSCQMFIIILLDLEAECIKYKLDNGYFENLFLICKKDGLKITTRSCWCFSVDGWLLWTLCDT